jgi:UDP-4-amino-4,6-dideoxy-N-acetyl-beta-L-altrosamine N-acetyltransferase
MEGLPVKRGMKMNYVLRELAREDLAVINEWRNDADLIGKLGAVFRFVNAEVDGKWFDSYMNARAHNIRLAICERESGHIVGAIYLLDIDWVSRSGELSIWIGNPAHRNKGAGRDAMAALLRHAFQDMNLHRVWLRVLSGNDPAIALYTKMGFVEEGRWREAVFKSGRYQDFLQMSCLDREFRLLHEA